MESGLRHTRGVKRRRSGTVYSTLHGRTCPRCGWPEKDCRCSQPGAESVPDRITARLSIERSGRRGKTVTVVYGLPRNEEFLKGLCKELKRSLGSGGTTGEDRVEIQGDHLERLRELLRERGWTVKG